MDENVYTAERKVFTIFDAFAATGGIMGVVLAISRLILGGVQESLFVITLAKKLLF